MPIFSQDDGPINELNDDEPVFEDDSGPGFASPSSSDNADASFVLVHGDAEAGTAWILVGEQQANAAAACEPDDVAVYFLDLQCLVESRRPTSLHLIEDKEVLFFTMGDASAEHIVYDKAAAFGRMCQDAGAVEVEFVWLGIDLEARLADGDIELRRKRLASVINRKGKRPAKVKPPAPSPTQRSISAKRATLEAVARNEGRPVIDVTQDRLDVIDELIGALKNGPDRDRLFDLGGDLAVTTTDEIGATVAEIVDEERLLNLLARAAQMISVTSRGINSAWPESKTLTALFGRHRDFRPLRGIAPSPIVREDNTIATEEGYDEASHVLLDLDGLDLQIPDAPTKVEVRKAVDLLVDDWLGDFPFASKADKANALALILTYPLRELVSLVPFAVISAKSQGTGKSKLIALIVLLFTRTMPVWDSLPGSEEETRKQITTLLATAPPFLVFDESPRIGGKAINRLGTATTWSDRLLGGNKRAALPNRAVMVATGNNVEVLGDTRRRYYPIELFYDGECPENRPESEFRHPDIEAWTEAHRNELLVAVFTLIRAWQVAGRPKRTTSFGSFERWEAVVGGVIENAGVDDFLANLAEHRESVDFDEGLWVAHCEWLAETFPGGEFTTRSAMEKMLTRLNNMRIIDPNADLPPGIDGSPLDPTYAAKLGKLYNQRHGRWSGGYRVGKASGKTGNKTKWLIETAPRLLRERAESAAAEAAVASQAKAAEEHRQAAQDLPGLKAQLAQLEADGADPQQIKLARLLVENAELVLARDESAATTTEEDAS